MIVALGSAIAMMTSQLPVDAPRCERQGDTFHLSGRIDAELSACVLNTFSGEVSEVVVNSQGGDADHALLIAEKMEGARFTLRVRGQCSSGCANLILPLAARVVVEPGSYILLHGSLDPEQMEREILRPKARLISRWLRENPNLDRAVLEANYDAATARNYALLERLQAFANRNAIHPGWLFYREPGDRGLGAHVSGRIQRQNPDFVLVEEPLMRSCLPRVQVEPFQAGLESGFIDVRERYGLFRASGGSRSLDLVCSSRSEADQRQARQGPEGGVS